MHFRCQLQAQGCHIMVIFPFLPQLILTFKNLLGRLTVLRKTVDLHLLVFQKEYSSGAATWIKCIGQVWGREVQACMPFSRHATRSPGTEMCSPNRKLSRSHCQAFVYFSCQPLSYPHPRGQQTKHLIFLRPSPILRPPRVTSHIFLLSQRLNKRVYPKCWIQTVVSSKYLMNIN